MGIYHVFYCEEFNDDALGDNENPLRKKFNSIVDDLKENKHTNLGDVKLIKGDGGVKYFRAKLSEADRLLFSNINYNGEEGFVLLEVILNHEYNKSKFLKDRAKIKFIKIICKENGKNVLNDMEISDASKIRWLGKFIKFSVKQEDIVENFEGKFELPLVVSGNAGSGKTSVALEKLKKIEEELEGGKILFITLSEYLIKQSKELYEYEYWDESFNQLRKGISERIDFLSIHEFLERVTKDVEGKRAIHRNIFSTWFEKMCFQPKFKHYKKDGGKVFEEITAVIAGGGFGREGGREQYLKLGKRQSIFSVVKRENIYDLFEEFKKFVRESSVYYDASLIAHECFEDVESEKFRDIYDVVVVDEVQDLTRSMLSLILKSSKSNFLLCGDVNQVIHPSFFSLSKLKNFLCTNILNKGKELKVCILEKNYRNSQQVIELANRILHFKNYCFASEDTISKEEKKAFFMKSDTEKTGYVGFIVDDKEIAKRVSGSIDYAILILTDSYKQEAKKCFETPLIFSVQEAKGLEFKNVILYKFDEAYYKIWNIICPGKAKSKKGTIDRIRSSYSEGNVNTSKPKDKKDKSFEEHKFYINALYVGVTRAIDNVYIIGDIEQHKLLKIFVPGEEVNMVDTASIEEKNSSFEEWKNMALDLIKKGSIEQAQGIVEKLLHNEEYVQEIVDALKVHGWNEKAEEVQYTLKQAKSKQSKSLLEKLKSLRYSAENLINSSFVHLSTVKSCSKSYGSDSNVAFWSTTKEGSYYLRNAHYLVNTYQTYFSGSNDEHINLINDVLTRLEFNPNHMSRGYTDEAYDGKTECFVSKGQGTLYYKLLHSGSRRDLREFISMVEPGIEIPAKIILESIKQRLQLFFSEQFLNAIKNNDPSAVEDSIKNGLIIENEVTDGRTPLHHAVNKGNVAIVNILLEKKLGTFAFFQRAYDSNSKYDFVNARTSICGDTPLHIAAKRGFLDVTKSLLNHGAIYNIQNNEGKTPVNVSKVQSINNLLKLVEELFEDANRGSVQIMDKLKAMKLDEFLAVINAENEQRTTLLRVVKHNETQKLISSFRERGLNHFDLAIDFFSQPTQQKLKSIFFEKSFDAIKHDNSNAVKICLDSAKVLTVDNDDIEDNRGRTLLHHAVEKCNISIIKILLQNNSDPNKTTAKGNTPLHIASLKGYTEVVEILLKHVKEKPFDDKLDSFVNARTIAKGTTALHVAAKNGYLAIVKLLLDYTADPCAQDKSGITPLDLAQKMLIQDPKNNDLEEIINILNLHIQQKKTSKPESQLSDKSGSQSETGVLQ